MNAPIVEIVFSVVNPSVGQVVGVAARHALVAQPVLHQERGVEADEQQPEVHLAEPLVEHPAGHLREPEVEAGEHREHDGAEQHVVEVRHHEVGVGDVEVQRRAGQEDAGQAAEQERDQEADANSIGVSKVSWPRHIVPIQLKNFTPVGTAIRNVMNEKNGSSTAPVANMWCAHTAIDSAAIAMRRDDQALVAEDRLAAEHRDDLGDDAEERQRDDVDLGVAEEPEQVLPQDRAAVGRVEDVRAEVPVGLQRRAARRPAPGRPSAPGSTVTRMFQVKIGIRNIVMPGARMQMIVVMKLTAPRIVPRPADRQAHDPQVAADARASGSRRTAACRRTSRSRPRRPG